jgi:hypothetical protein
MICSITKPASVVFYRNFATRDPAMRKTDGLLVEVITSTGATSNERIATTAASTPRLRGH